MAKRKRRKSYQNRPRAAAPRPSGISSEYHSGPRSDTEYSYAGSTAVPAGNRKKQRRSTRKRRPAPTSDPRRNPSARRKKRLPRDVEPFSFEEAKRRHPRKKRESSGHAGEVVYRVLLAGMILAALLFIASVFFEVKKVEVTGTSQYLPEQVAAISGIETGDKLLFINRFEIWDHIRAELPYVKALQVRQKFPNTVVLEITERQPAAKLVNAGISYIIDEEAVLLEYTALGDDFLLPVIHGAAPVETTLGKELVFEDELMAESLKNILAELIGTSWIEQIVDINLEKIYNLSFNYANRYTVTLGDASDLPKKLAVLSEVLERLRETDQGVIDVSAPEMSRFLPYTT